MNPSVNILLVDDDNRNLDVLETILQSPHYRLVRAQNADQALLELMSAEFAAIVLDIHMPDMNGLELAQLIKQRKKTQHLPIIFLTAYYQEDEHIMQGYGAGAVDYLSKPCNPTILRSKVEIFVDLFRKTRALETEIAERRQIERRVRELNEQLAQRVTDLAKVNSELESFSYSVSHDLRAPLRQVVGFVGLLKKSAGGRLDSGSLEFLSLIHDATTRMGQLIDDLLAFSRYGRVELNYRVINLQQVVYQAQHSLQLASQERHIEWKIDPLPNVTGDPAMLLQVFVNLLENAIKFTRPRTNATIEIGYLADADESIIYVKDNGVGFDPQFSNKLFGVFQRLHTLSEFEGTGIGLANVRRIVQRHGGRTWAEGRLGEGATIFFSLPTAESPMILEKECAIND
jgi:two-component system, sensor histidine kinase and response regulator